MKSNFSFTVFLVFLLAIFSANAQDTYWSKSENITNANRSKLQSLDESEYQMYNLDLNTFKNKLKGAPLRTGQVSKSQVEILLPSHKGKLERFRVMESPVLSDELSIKYPNIKTYVGYSIDKPGARVRFSVTPQGVQTMISYPDKHVLFTAPVNKGNAIEYVAYERTSQRKDKDGFECLTEDETYEIKESLHLESNRDANDQTLRRFRIAIATNAEYTNFWNDGNNANGNAQADALAQVVSTLNRTNEVFEVDMAITFTLVTGTELIYTNSATDPFSPGQFNSQAQSTFTSEVGEANYDIGHLFAKSGKGGSAGFIGRVCVDGSKGSAYSAHDFLDNDGGPYMSDFFDIDYVPHEIGHQMGANHTYSHVNEGTGVNFEPGSGTTIMGYAGITSSDVQDHSDPYFHYGSISQILVNLQTRTCFTTTNIANNPPVANAGPDFTIPGGTPFVLRGSATDADNGDSLTYTWEQIDSGTTTTGNFGPTRTTGPLWRSRPPSSNPNRYMPILSRVIQGKLTETNPVETEDNSSWETVSTVSRSLNFALTVRDRSEMNGTGQFPQSDFDFMTVTVDGTVDPFTVDTPNPWAQNTNQTITWNVGSTDSSPINSFNVNIKLSTDGGLTFPTLLASNTPNDGSESVMMPNISDSTNAIIMVEAADNIFYNVSGVFEITSNSTFSLSNTTGDIATCKDDEVTFDLVFTVANGFSESTSFSASGHPSGSTVTFTPDSSDSNLNFQMKVSNLNSVSVADYPIIITATSKSVTKNLTVNLSKSSSCASRGSTTYETSTTLLQFNTINNSSAKPSGYSDYTNISTNIKRDESYDLTVNVNTDGNFTTHTIVWIDWNQDCTFDDTTERYDLGTARNVDDGSTSLSALSIAVPSDAKLGSTLLRVSTQYNGDPTACQIGFDGEVEDYTVVVEEATASIEDFAFEGFNLYPNPTKGEFTLKFTTVSNSGVNIKVMDVSGRTIMRKSYQNVSNRFSEQIVLNRIATGIYLVQIQNGNKQTTRKLVVE